MDSRPTRRLARIAGTTLPGVVFVLLPKCPMCLAVWLAATGVSVPFAAVAPVRRSLALLWIISLLMVLRRARAWKCR